MLEIPTPRWSTIQAAKLGRVPPSGAGFWVGDKYIAARSNEFGHANYEVEVAAD